MKRTLLLVVFIAGLVAGGRSADAGAKLHPESFNATAQSCNDVVVLPNFTNAVQFRLYTNAAPEALHLFNTFEIEAYGERLLSSPGGDVLQRWLATSPTNTSLHNILVNGAGPQLALTNGMAVVEQAAGPDWRYLALDASQAYRGRLEQFRRSILFVEPDLFVIHDHLVAKKLVSFEMFLHPPAATRVDAIWRDLRLDLSKAGLRINTPGGRHVLRAWEQTESPADALLPGTVTMKLGPTSHLAQLDLLTVFVVYPGGAKKDFAFKLLESNNAIGARIHREALPTLVAFKTDASAGKASLTGFEFNGPVGVSVFKPKPKAP